MMKESIISILISIANQTKKNKTMMKELIISQLISSVIWLFICSFFYVGWKFFSEIKRKKRIRGYLSERVDDLEERVWIVEKEINGKKNTDSMDSRD